MAMKKTELEAHRAEYEARMSSARAAERKGLYRVALEQAASTWDYIDGMMQYERRYQDAEFDSVPAIEMVLKYAPLLFQFESLNRLATLLENSKRIEKHTSADLGEQLRAARQRMWDNHRLWSYLEANSDARQDQLRMRLGGDQDYWRAIAEAWEQMGLLRRVPEGDSYRLLFTTRMDEVVKGKCSACGSVADAPKRTFLCRVTCNRCKEDALFVIVENMQEYPLRK